MRSASELRIREKCFSTQNYQLERNALTYKIISWREVFQHTKLLIGEKCSNKKKIIFESMFELRERTLLNSNMIDLVFVNILHD